MTAPRDPWADPSTPTEQGAPYAGPPQTAPQPYAAPAWGPPPYGYPAGGYGLPWAPPPPRPPQRPGQVITAAVLAFVQAGVGLIASLYIWMFASIADLAVSEVPQGFAPGRLDALAREGTVLAVVGLAAAVLLVGAGVWALNSRSPGAWRLLVAAHAVQVVLAVYWTVRLLAVVDEAPGSGSGGAVASVSLFFLAGPLTSLGLLLVGGGRRWFTDRRPAGG